MKFLFFLSRVINFVNEDQIASDLIGILREWGNEKLRLIDLVIYLIFSSSYRTIL